MDEHVHHSYKMYDRFEIIDDFENPSDAIGKQGYVWYIEGEDHDLPDMVGVILDDYPNTLSWFYACMLKPL